MYLLQCQVSFMNKSEVAKRVGWEHNQTRLKLFLTESTLYVRIEECLSVSCDHHCVEVGLGIIESSYLLYQISLWSARYLLTVSLLRELAKFPSRT